MSSFSPKLWTIWWMNKMLVDWLINYISTFFNRGDMISVMVFITAMGKGSWVFTCRWNLFLVLQSHLIKLNAWPCVFLNQESWWPSSQHCPTRNSDQMTIGTLPIKSWYDIIRTFARTAPFLLQWHIESFSSIAIMNTYSRCNDLEKYKSWCWNQFQVSVLNLSVASIKPWILIICE